MPTDESLRNAVITEALKTGATLAGIASRDALAASGSHIAYPRMDDYQGVGTVQQGDTLPPERLFQWPEAARSVLVIALSHPRDKPELDWWDGKGTPGNRMLMDIAKRTRARLKDELGLATHALHYYVEKGGVFLKDAAVLAGLGSLGCSNLLVTPSHGPRVRLRAVFLEDAFTPTGPLNYDPCEGCPMPCRSVCPERAMDAPLAAREDILNASSSLPARDGHFQRALCNQRMEQDIADSRAESSQDHVQAPSPIRYCRKCELACPAGSGTSGMKTVPQL